LTRYDGRSGEVTPMLAAQKLAACRNIYAIVDFPKAGIEFPPELQSPNYLFSWLPDDVAVIQSPVIITPRDTERFFPLLEEAWGSDAAVCFFSSLPTPEMVEHLRQTTGYSPSDPGSGLLGYFWPKILLTMLNSSTMPELKRLFDQVDAVLLESDESPSGWSIAAGDQSGLENDAGIVAGE
jgi:hypothetical protein